MNRADLYLRKSASEPNPVRAASETRLSACAKSALMEAFFLSVLGLAGFFAPHRLFALFELIVITGTLPPLPTGPALIWFQLFMAIGCGYIGMWYAVAAISNHTAFFKASVVARCVMLPLFHLSLAASGMTSTAWPEAAIPVEFVLGLHMLWCLRKEKSH